MQVDWNEAINEILSGKITCQSCGISGDTMVVGYTRDTDAAQFALRCQECTDKSDCDARKLVVVCENCARRYRVNGRQMNEVGMMSMLLDECRHNMEDSVEYLANYWKEDIDVDYDTMLKGLHEVDTELFREENGWRKTLEEEYLQLHRWFRESRSPIPDPGWRSQYVEEVIQLGYSTLLGD